MADILRVGFAKNAPEANWMCPRFPTLDPRLGSCPYPGLCAELIGYLARMANLTIVPIVIESVPDDVEWGKKQKDGSWSGAFGYIYNDTVDTVCLLAQKNEMREEDFEFTQVIYQTPVALVSRKLTETMPPNLWSPYEVLSLQVWIATLIGWISFTVTLSLIEAFREKIAFRQVFARLMQGSYEESFSFHPLGNFLSFLYSITAMIIVSNLYGSNTIAVIMKERSFDRFNSVAEAAALVASGQLKLIDYQSSILVTLLGEYSTSGTQLLKDAVNINPAVRIIKHLKQNSADLDVNDLDEVFALLQTGRYMVGEIIDSRFMMQARAQCNLSIFDQGLPELLVQLLWNRKSAHQLKRINEAIGVSREFIERTRKKYLALDELPFTMIRKNCTEQKIVLASQQPLDFPSTAGIFLMVPTGLIVACFIFIVELLAKSRKATTVKH